MFVTILWGWRLCIRDFFCHIFQVKIWPRFHVKVYCSFNPLTTIVPHHIESIQFICIANQWLISLWWGTLVVNGLWYQEGFSWKIRLTGTTKYRAKTTATHLYIFIYLIYFTLTIGIDIGIKNDQDETVLDVLCSHPSQMSQEITALIYGNVIVGYKKDWQNGYCQLDEFIHSDFMWRHLFRFWLMKFDNVAVINLFKVNNRNTQTVLQNLFKVWTGFFLFF